jgi:exosome complex component RRP40
MLVDDEGDGEERGGEGEEKGGDGEEVGEVGEGGEGGGGEEWGVDSVVLPGDDVAPVAMRLKLDEANSTTPLRLGAGLRYVPAPEEEGEGGRDRIVVTKAGILRWHRPNRLEVEASGRRYIPRVGDCVVGTVVDKGSEHYRVSFGGTSAGLLPVLAFDGATKRNRPRLERGMLVYCRLAAVDKALEPELSCQVASGPRRDWVTRQSVFGQLVDGTTFSVSLGLARRLLQTPCAVLEALGERVAFEIAVGANGRVWVNAESIAHVTLVHGAILNTEHLIDDQVRAMVKEVLVDFE